VFQVILVFICSHFFSCFAFFFWMIFLHSSSHHSFLGVLLCVCITALAASTIAVFIYSHSSFISCLGARFINLLCNSDLHSLSFDGFYRFILFHFSTGFNFFLYIALRCCLINAFTKKWSESLLGLLIDLLLSLIYLHLHMINFVSCILIW
jgi:hypothetical protein